MDRIAYERVREEIRIKDKAEDKGENEVYLQPVRSLSTRRDVPAALPPRRTPYPLCRMLGGPYAGLDEHGKLRVHRISTSGPSSP